MPLYEMLVENGYEVQLEIEEDLTHADLKVHFPLYLQNKVEEILDKNILLYLTLKNLLSIRLTLGI